MGVGFEQMLDGCYRFSLHRRFDLFFLQKDAQKHKVHDLN